MPRTGRDRLLDSINEGYGALLSVVEDTEGRGIGSPGPCWRRPARGEHELWSCPEMDRLADELL